MFNASRTNVHAEARSGRPSVVTDDLVRDEAIHENRRFTIKTLSEAFPPISRTVLFEIVSDRLNYRKLCSRLVPKMLTDVHKTKRLGSALTFLTRYSEYGENFLNQIVTGGETWVCHFTPESKQQSMEWRHTHSPKKQKFKVTMSSQKIMCTVFWDRKGVLLTEFLPRGETINAARYCETLTKLRCAIQNERRGMLSKGIVLLHDNARPLAAGVTQSSHFDHFLFLSTVPHPTVRQPIQMLDIMDVDENSQLCAVWMIVKLITELVFLIPGMRMMFKLMIISFILEMSACERITSPDKVISELSKCYFQELVPNEIQKQVQKNIKYAVWSIARSWKDVSPDTLKTARHNLWPGTIFHGEDDEDDSHKFEGFRISQTKVEIFQLMDFEQKCGGVVINEDDITEVFHCDDNGSIINQLMNGEICSMVLNPENIAADSEESDRELIENEKHSIHKLVRIPDTAITGVEEEWNFVTEQEIMPVYRIKEKVLTQKTKELKKTYIERNV
ncbi:Histone-lysine N-methyltransferase SETMAR, partial [Stegodyphus mimosarum]